MLNSKIIKKVYKMTTFNLNKYWNQLRTDSLLNPFNPHFKEEEVNAKMDEVCDIFKGADISDYDKVECFKLLETLLSSIKISDIYPSSYKFFKDNIESSNSSISEIYVAIMALLCRDYLLIEDSRRMYLQESRVVSMENLEAINFKLGDSAIGNINATGALECGVDLTSILLNYLYYYDDKKIDYASLTNKTNNFVNNIKNLVRAANVLWLAKSSFESAIWNFGYILFRENNIYIKYNSDKRLKLEYIGLIRFKEIAFSHYYILMKHLKFEKYICRYKKNNRIKNVYIRDGYIQYSTERGYDKNENDIYVDYLTQLECFYSFVNESCFSKANYSSLNVKYCISMLSIITNLLQKINIENIISDDSVSKKDDFLKFPIRIKIADLERLLYEKSSFSKEQITAFLRLLSSDKSNQLNLWDTPLINDENAYLISFLPLTQPVICRFIDVWLSKGGVSLDDRGKIFEDFVKARLKSILEKKGVNFRIVETNSFVNKNKEKEEIDFILEIEDMLILGEIKCIVYPMSNRDRYNSFDKLKKGCNQIIKKTDFLLRNKKHFKNKIQNLNDNNIIRVVITNFPIFSGQNYKDIPIIDMSLLTNYFSQGSLGIIKNTQDNGISVVKTFKETKYYSDNHSMAHNFKSFINNPPPIYSKYDKIDVVTNKITPEGLNINIYIEQAISNLDTYSSL